MSQATLNNNETQNLNANTEVKITNNSNDQGAFRITVHGNPETDTDYTIAGNSSKNILAQENYTVKNTGNIALSLTW